MVSNAKILSALESAKNYLDMSISALESGDRNSFAKHFWHVSAELEYALFLFSIDFQEVNFDKSRLKSNLDAGKSGVSNILIEIRSLLDDAEKFLAESKMLDAYESVYMARHYVFAVQEDFAKKSVKRLEGNR